MKLYLVRHGESEANVKHEISDDIEGHIHLTPKGKKQAKNAGNILKDKGIEIIFASPFLRTQETAKLINDSLKLNVIETTLIRERCTGMDGKPLSEWMNFISGKDYFKLKPKGGESFSHEKKRLRDFLKFLKTTNFKSVLLVSHGEPIKVLKELLNHLPNSDFEFNDPKNCEIMEFNL